MAIALLTHAIAHGVNGATTSGIDTTGASLLVMVEADYTAGPGVTISDSKSNTWQHLTIFVYTAGNMRVRIHYAWNPTVGTGHTFTSAGTGVYTNIAVASFSGVDTGSDPYNADVTGLSDFLTSTSQAMRTGSVTLAAGDLAIAGEGTPFGQTFTWAIDTGFTITDQFADGTTEGSGLAYLINTGSTGAKNPGWTGGASCSGAATIATFRAASGGGSPSLTPAQGALALAGKGLNLGFAINMPDEL